MICTLMKHAFFYLLVVGSAQLIIGYWILAIKSKKDMTWHITISTAILAIGLALLNTM